MRYPDEVVEDVRVRNDIVDVVSQYVKLTRRGGRYFGLCPFHGEKTPSFSVSRETQMFHCFGCGASGNVITFLMKFENCSFREALSTLADRAGVELPPLSYGGDSPAFKEKKSQLLGIQKAAARFYHVQLRSEAGREGMEYLTHRGLTMDTVKKFGLGFAGNYGSGLYPYLKSLGYSDELLRESGLFLTDERRGMYERFHNRVMFPIMDSGSHVIGFGGRVMGEGNPKYLNSPETAIFDKGRNLYGLQEAKRSRRENLILCEGYMDVIAMHQAGFNNAVASLGTALTPGHAHLLNQYKKPVLLIYDSDAAGVRAALRAIPILRDAGVPSRVVNLDPHKDPDEFIGAEGADAFEERLRDARDSVMFQVEEAKRDLSLDDPQGRNKFFDRCAELILNLKDELERNLYINTIVTEYAASWGVSAEDLRKRVNNLALSGRPVRERIRPLPQKGEQAQKETGSLQAQRLMLSWMARDPAAFEEGKKYLKPEDFTDPLYRSLAEMLYEQNGQVNPASLVNSFTELEEQQKAAAVFAEGESPEGRAFADTLLRIRQDSLSRMSSGDPGDMEALQKIVQARKELETLKRQLAQLPNTWRP